ADRELGGEDTMHPARSARNGFSRRRRLARPHERAVPARHDSFLRLQHDVAIVRRVGREERKQPTVLELLEKPVGIVLRELVACERYDAGRRAVMNDTAPCLGSRYVDGLAVRPLEA